MMNFKKYERYQSINLSDRQWPSRTIEKAPAWCSVDLRDGNQALPIPMNVEEKLEMFKLLLKMGFKEIEVGFPSASDTEYKFLRRIIEENLIPDDVTVQVLTQSREHLIRKSFEALKGAKRAVIHLYNSTSTLQRRVVFNKSREEIIEIAVQGAKLVKQLAEENKNIKIIHEYSPESFTGTELDYALEICEAVMDVWQPTPENKVIFNLPATVEMSTPNVYADQIEWFSRNIKNRDSVIISLHAHNDRGTSVAATELALLAGADRVEGTLFGNGERTGNVDIITLAMNLYSQGIDPELNLENMDRIVKISENCTKIPVHIRHPYAGELVYTAFSGSHQDAIRKGLNLMEDKENTIWAVPYLPIDPSDVGREYEAIIRINSQSGKGGVAFIMENDFGFKLPKEMHPEFGEIIKNVSDEKGDEIKPNAIYEIFKKTYLEINSPIKLNKYEVEEKEDLKEDKNEVVLKAEMTVNGEEKKIISKGNGPIDAFFNTLKDVGFSGYKFISYDEHALTTGSDSKAVSYIELENSNGQRFFGVGVAQNINTASIKAMVSAVNRSYK